MNEGYLLIGRRIAAARALRRLTQTELGQGIGVTWRTISSVESGKSMLRGDRIGAAARVLQVSADYLLGLTEDRTPKAMEAAVA